MEGITAAIVGFIFVCILFPRLVRNRPQFYSAVGAIAAYIVLNSLAAMIGAAGFYRFAGGMSGLLLVGSFLLLILATGGLSLKDLSGEFLNAFEVIRRGETQKEVIVPLRGQKPLDRNSPGEIPPPPAYTINTPPAPPRESGSLPVE